MPLPDAFPRSNYLLLSILILPSPESLTLLNALIMAANLGEKGQRYLATLIVCNAIAIIATILRVWCKLVQMKSGFRSLHSDDWFIIAATVSYLSAASAAYWGLFAGSQGMEIGEITADLMAAPSPVKVKKMQNYLEVTGNY